VAFLALPLLLVVSQFVSMQLMQPQNQDPQQQQANVILKFLPIMIGWFSLNVPAALCVYWLVNNIVTTASTLWVRSTMKMEPVGTTSGGGASSSKMDTSSVFAPPPIRDRPAGFGTTINKFDDDDSGVKPITAVDAEVVSKTTNLSDDDDDDEDDDESGTGMQSASQKVRSLLCCGPDQTLPEA
jgi:YidC/Oxa1 family membrane protein insertase